MLKPPEAVGRLLESDPYLHPYRDILLRRFQRLQTTTQRLLKTKGSLEAATSGHQFFGLHAEDEQWVFREWAPNATAISLIGEMTNWQERPAFALKRVSPQGVWELRLPLTALHHESLYRLRIHWNGGCGDRIPAYARRVVQDPHTQIFNAQVWQPPTPYRWRSTIPPAHPAALLVYEAHVGMAQAEERVGTYREFAQKVLPRIVAGGYNALQLMAVQQHPYYGSFGYHVSSFFAASSRFGTPEDLKALIDSAHQAGLLVFVDLVHSHAVSNQNEGLSLFDGTLDQYFHRGPRGFHAAWDSRCFDYGKDEVLLFLMSNCRFWLEEYRVDGFRFDGVTSMLYTHHGLGRAFVSYDAYFGDDVDEDALVYLALANLLIHSVRPDALTIAEDVSGMPGLAQPLADGGWGFDYRFAMGIPDFWIRLVKDTRDEDWPLGVLWSELTNRRAAEKTISYAESHDQALVGDQTLFFRLVGNAIYDHMGVEDSDLRVDRGMALHKMIRLITMATAGNGYLNFMGNEFGHPDWIDFPREGNAWSYRYARRQWFLVDDPHLKYTQLGRFDKDMLALARNTRLLTTPRVDLLWEHTDDKVLAFQRAGRLFVFNFHPSASPTDYAIPAAPGKYRLLFDTDARSYGGHGRLAPDQEHLTLPPSPPGEAGRHHLRLYLPARSAQVLEKLD